ncbi:DNA-binding IclR family transcriptional regulator [Nakamurella sp. UYEF19]|uniref:IclR family transcriptional regulator n=1 Tax=Nakamurella sp. UYEF19 TaxID=1756392 RepID=UPI003393CC11
MAGGSGSAGRSVTSRALAVLSAFDTDLPRAGLSEIAARAGLPLSTCHRLVAELVAWGGLVRRPDGRYEIGPRLWELGLLAPVSRELRDVALPFMQDLAATTGENVQIAVRRGLQALYVERISGTRSVAVVSRSGSELPLHATGVGKVLLAHADPGVIAEAMDHLIRVTAFTVVERGRMLRQLAEIRRRGWSETAQEMTIGTYSIAVPVSDRSGRVIAALGIVAAGNRGGLAKLAPALMLAARGISRSIGKSDPSSGSRPSIDSGR